MTVSELPQAGSHVLVKIHDTLVRETKYKYQDCNKNLPNSITGRILIVQVKNQTTVCQPILERLKFLSVSFTKIYLKERNSPNGNYSISIPFKDYAPCEEKISTALKDTSKLHTQLKTPNSTAYRLNIAGCIKGTPTPFPPYLTQSWVTRS